jgi:hypothetical protein
VRDGGHHIACAVGPHAGGELCDAAERHRVLFVISAVLAAYMVLAMCLTAVTKRTILPTGHFKKAADIPGRQPVEAVELPWAEPGIKQGQ